MFMRRMAGGMDWLGGMVGSADPAEGEVRFYAHPYPVSYGFISKWNPVAAEYIDFSAEHFTEGMVMRVQLANTANPDGVVFRFGEESEPAQALDNGGFGCRMRICLKMEMMPIFILECTARRSVR